MEVANPLSSASATMTFHPRDWSLNSKDAWLYGIVVGWDETSLEELTMQHGWDHKDVLRLQRLRRRFIELEGKHDERTGRDRES